MRYFKGGAILILALLAAQLAGCANDFRYQEGLGWIQYNEAEKARLDRAGFPQYTNDG